MFQPRLALVAEVGSRARGTGLCTVLTAATPHRGPRAFGTGGDAGLSPQIRAWKPREEGRSGGQHVSLIPRERPCRELALAAAF